MLKEEKKALRAKIKEKRDALSAEYMKDADERIADAVCSSEAFQNAAVIFAYISVQGEPDTKRIIETALRQGKVLCVPKCFGKGIMSTVRIRSYEDLKPGLLGIPEPADCSEVIEEGKIGLGIIPCISANQKGERIGHGAGYYDRFFEKSKCKTICLCYGKLQSERIPMGEHDALMDAIATEEGLFRTK